MHFSLKVKGYNDKYQIHKAPWTNKQNMVIQINICIFKIKIAMTNCETMGRMQSYLLL